MEFDGIFLTAMSFAMGRILSFSSVCKFVSIEMKSAFDETGKTKEVIGRNYGFIDNKGAPPIKYVKS